MNRHAGRWRMALCAAAVVLGVTACTSGSTDGPTTSGASTSASLTVTPSVADVSSVATSPTPSVASVPPSSDAPPASLDPAAQEAADRAAVEAQWVKFWNLYINFLKIPEAERDLLAADVAAEPTRGNLQKFAADFQAQGKDNYGEVTHRLSWLDPIDGGNQAVLADCQDQSQFGSIDIATGEKLSHGVERDNVKGVFVKGEDGIWRVGEIYYLTSIPC